MLTAAKNDRLTRVGPGTPMGNLLRRYWMPIGGASQLTAERRSSRSGSSVKTSRSTRTSAAAPASSRATARTAAPTFPAARWRKPACAASITAGSSTRAAPASSSPTRRSPRPIRKAARAAPSPPIRCANWPACCGPIWARSRRRNCRCGSRSLTPTVSARSSPRRCPATGSSARRTPSTRCISNGCTTIGARACAAAGAGRASSQAALRRVRTRLRLPPHPRGRRRSRPQLVGRPRGAVAERLLSRHAFRMARAGRRREHAQHCLVLHARAEGARALCAGRACRPG